MTKRTTKEIAFRLSPELIERVDQVAHERVVSRNLLVTRAIEAFLDNLVPLDRSL